MIDSTVVASTLPRIDYRYIEVAKVPDVSCRKRRVPRKRDPGDLGVAKVNGSPGFLALCRQDGGLDCSGAVEVENAVLEVLLQQLREGPLE